jgi:hypothetical protein
LVKLQLDFLPKFLNEKLVNPLVDATVKTGVINLLPDKQFIPAVYFNIHRKWPNLSNPLTFSEKIQWIKIYGNLVGYTKYVDKLEVRNFIANMLGPEHLVPLLGSWNNFEEIHFDRLPKQFVLKATHGSAYVYVCKDKTTMNRGLLKKTVTKWMGENYYKITREPQYKHCKPKIVCEKYLEDANGKLVDYKVFCSNGEPRIVEVVWDRFTDNKVDIYKDLNWKTLDIGYAETQRSVADPAKPNSLGKMLEISKILSKMFPFVRVDMYAIDGVVYVGELTFTPADGKEIFDPPEADYELGKLIDISRY